jgi:large subunit ribosomal protein L20
VPRVKRGNKRRLKRKKVLGLAKGYYQGKSKLYRYAKEAVDRGQKFAYIGRKLKKRDFRSLWIIRINAGARLNGLSYSRLMHGLALAGIDINRKMLAEMAARDAAGFAKLAEQAKAALPVVEPTDPEPTEETVAA